MSLDVETISDGVVSPEMDLPWFRISEDGELRWEASRNLNNGGWDVWDVASRPSQRLTQGHPDHDRIVTICKETTND